MKKSLKFITILLVSFLMITQVNAKEINHFKADAKEKIENEENINGSFALAASKTNYKGKSNGIGFIAGDEINFEGESEYLALAGNNIKISGTVNKDALITGKDVTLKDTANIKRDIIIIADSVEINGNIDRNISIYATSITLKSAQISGNIKTYSNKLTINEKTNIKGTLSYSKSTQTKIDKKANINKINKTKEIETEKDQIGTQIMSIFYSFASLLLIFALLTLMLPKMFKNLEQEYEKLDFNKLVETSAKGLALILLLPIIILLLIFTSFGMPLALIILALYLITIYLSTIFTSYLLGYKIWQKYINKDINMLALGLLGLVIIFTLNLIPGIQIIAKLFTIIIGVGIIYIITSKQIRSTK